MLETHDRVFALPMQVRQSQPVYFTDAFGHVVPFHLEWVFSREILEDWLLRRFQSVGRDKIVRQEYALSDEKTKRELDLLDDWHTLFYPGMHVSMDMIYAIPECYITLCPGCKHEYIEDANQHFKWYVRRKVTDLTLTGK